VLFNTSNITGWGHSVAMSKNSIGHNGALRFQASPLIQATRVLGLSTVMTKDFKQLDYAIVGRAGSKSTPSASITKTVCAALSVLKLTHNPSYPLLLVIFKSAIFLHNVGKL
jgi:hypothetical protein